jgi:hypothetical protein
MAAPVRNILDTISYITNLVILLKVEMSVYFDWWRWMLQVNYMEGAT